MGRIRALLDWPGVAVTREKQEALSSQWAIVRCDGTASQMVASGDALEAALREAMKNLERACGPIAGNLRPGQGVFCLTTMEELHERIGIADDLRAEVERLRELERLVREAPMAWTLSAERFSDVEKLLGTLDKLRAGAPKP